MRFAPADFLLDAFVQRLVRKREYRTLTFYAIFLFRSHLEDGSLPADVSELADHLGMPERDVAAGLDACVQSGKLRIEGGMVYHKRVVAQVERERAFRASQSEAGRRGGRPHKSLPSIDKNGDQGKGSLLGPESQPAPTPTPTPTPKPAPTPTPEPFARQPAAGLPSDIRTSLEIMAPGNLDAQEEILRDESRASGGAMIRSLDSLDRLSRSHPDWLQVTRERLQERLRTHRKARQGEEPEVAAALTWIEAHGGVVAVRKSISESGLSSPEWREREGAPLMVVAIVGHPRRYVQVTERPP
jgi:hypothetical protein